MHTLRLPTPEVYRAESMDFRFFLKWFDLALSKTHYDTENISDLYDPLRCPHWLLWMLGDTMGFKFDSRLPVAFNRYVLVYFMNVIRNRGSIDGVTLAAELNLKQFQIDLIAGKGYKNRYGEFVKPKSILYNRLEDLSIPVNSVMVTPYVKDGYIDITYLAEELPVDAVVEYARPIGMYIVQNAGVRVDAHTKLNIDARVIPHVAHYTRKDYASMQDTYNTERDKGWEANSDVNPKDINMGLRTIHTLQLCNNEEIVKSLIPENPHKPGDPLDGETLHDQEKIFGLGWQPQDVNITFPDDYVLPDQDNDIFMHKVRAWNLRYDKAREEAESADVYTIDNDRSKDILTPRPAVNPIMSVVGDAVRMDPEDQVLNKKYTKVHKDGTTTIDEY